MACCLASFGLKLMNTEDYKILKIMLFSRAVSNAVHLLGDVTHLYRPVESYNEQRLFTVETVMGLAVTVFCAYAFIYEVKAMPPSFLTQFIRATGMNFNEKSLFDSLRAQREL